jgi:transposase
MPRQRKSAAVLRVPRGGDLEAVSRALGITAATLTGWRDSFLAAGEASLSTRPADGEALESERLKAGLPHPGPPRGSGLRRPAPVPAGGPGRGP